MKKIIMISLLLMSLVFVGCNQKNKSCLDKVEEFCKYKKDYTECKSENFVKMCGVDECLERFGIERMNKTNEITEKDKQDMLEYNPQTYICFE